MDSHKLLIWLVLLVLGGIGIYLAAIYPLTTAPANSNEPATGALLNSLGERATGTPPQVRVINVRAEQGKFIPAEITANSGDTIDLRIQSDAENNFTIDEFGIRQILPEGFTLIRFTPEKKGTYVFYNSVRETMRGTLIVK